MMRQGSIDAGTIEWNRAGQQIRSFLVGNVEQKGFESTSPESLLPTQ